ncbi:TraY domain-containing protein [Sphingopyxis sp. SE2]|uniref:TraY domain-containing protein n=1 Tax=Sphingopyxis sp. SE2 TaxID=1586240 RepID=UPI0028BF8851|nr:TraY domain-containing protein [Sphingopyxis sp. SE2]MDT7531134.1 TraY domain-containing protein [Sphingopyxis sp. SE2]
MTIFNVRLSREDEAELTAAAKRSGRSKSEIARDAISAHLKTMADDEKRWETLQDDWSEYGSAVQDAYEALVGVQLGKLETVRKAFETRLVEIGNMDWQEAIEPVYEIFRRKVIEKSGLAYAPNPYIGGRDPKEPEMVAVIGFAADDTHDFVIPLEQVFYNYCDSAGWDAFNEIPAVFERARARLEAEDKSRERPSAN